MKEFDKVRMKRNGLIGTIVDVIDTDKGKKYIVESDTPNIKEGDYMTKWPLFDCNESDIEAL